MKWLDCGLYNHSSIDEHVISSFANTSSTVKKIFVNFPQCTECLISMAQIPPSGSDWSKCICTYILTNIFP